MAAKLKGYIKIMRPALMWSPGMVKQILPSNRNKKILAHVTVIFTSIIKPAEKISSSPKPELVVYSHQKLI